MTRFLSTADAARLLGVTPATIRLMERQGRLQAQGRTQGGIRLFERREVRRVAILRARERKRNARNPRRRKLRGSRSRRGRASERKPRRQRRLEHDDARLRALHAVAVMRREGRSLKAAAKRANVSPRTVLKKARQALRKRDGLYAAIPLDELRRPMRVLTERGLVVLDVRSSRVASRLATYWNAVDTYLRTGDRRALAPYVGRSLTAEGHRMRFVTEPRLLDRLANAGQVTFEELYEATA